jgi:hypothetical protein
LKGSGWSLAEKQWLTALALVGAALLFYQVWGYVGWLLADIPLRRTDLPVPADVMAGVERAERLIYCVAIGWCIVLAVLTLRARRLTWPLMLSVAWLLVYWQESLVNARQHAFTYNAYFLSREDWTPFFPFLAASKPLLHQPLLMEPLVFFWLIPLVGIGISALLRKLSRWTQSVPVMVLMGAGVGCAFETSFEFSAISQQLLAWNAVPATLSMHTATPQQWPLPELLLGAVWALPGIAWFYRDRGWLRWLDPQLGPSGARAATIRVLALSAAINIVFLAYNLVLMYVPATATAQFPPWLSG